MSIRLQLLAIALTTLLLPWAGCQYARELESTLRVSQENSLQSAADTIANALSAESDRVFTEVESGEPFDPRQGDLYLYPLRNEPLLDGYREDWGVAAEPSVLPTDSGLGARLQAGYTERFVYLYLEVDDAQFDPEPGDALPERQEFDRVDLRLRRQDGAEESYFFATGAPGPIQAQRIARGDSGIGHPVLEPRIQAFWLQTSRGYHLEARIPRSLAGSRLWIEAIDAMGGARAGFMGADSSIGGRMFMFTPGLGALLATFIGPGTKATVIDANALILGAAGAVTSSGSESTRDGGESWYRRFVTGDTSRWPLQAPAVDHLAGGTVSKALSGRPAAEWLRANPSQAALFAAAAPIRIGDRTGGAVVLEQAGDQLLESRDRALGHLFGLTLLGTALAAAVAFGIASWISVRINRLRTAADSAIGQDGKIRLECPNPTERTRSECWRAPSSDCWDASMSIRNICGLSAANSRTNCGLRSPSSARRSTISNRRMFDRTSGVTSPVHGKALCACSRS